MFPFKRQFQRLESSSIVTRLLAAAIAIYLSASGASAKSAAAPAVPKIRYIGVLQNLKTKQLSNGTFEFQLSDGRIMRVQLTPQRVHSVTTTAEVSAATCGPKPVPMTKCLVKEDVLLFEIRVVWSAHPDKSKIGKTVLAGSSPANGTLLMPWNDRPLASKLPQFIQAKVKAMTSPQMACESWDWLNIQNGQVLMPEWSAEDMRQNRETGQSENRSVGSFRDLVFDFDGTKMNLKSFARQHGQIGFLMMLGGAETTAVTQIDRSGDVCQAALQIANPTQPIIKLYNDQIIPKHSEANARSWSINELTKAVHFRNDSTYVDTTRSQLTDEMKFLDALGLIKIEIKNENNEQIFEFSFRELN
jgi:hypothetical protein